MLKRLTILLSGLMFAMSAFADNSSNNPYLTKMQQAFDRSNAQAQSQFDKSFPKPAAPVLDNSNTKSTTMAPSSAPKNTTATSNTANANNNYANQQNPQPIQPSAPAQSDANNSNTKQNQPFNIYAPPGANNNPQQNKANSNNVTPNIFR